ncbi:hypothetical protein [Cetobacterium sp.]|uniref:hypothetical protein n=1 Tax=Cetobacterium sp. TaxID=2071632 RepID=UPI003EE7B7C7
MICPCCNKLIPNSSSVIGVVEDNCLNIKCPLCFEYFILKDKIIEARVLPIPKKRPKVIKYTKVNKKKELLLKQLESLIYNNFNLTNKELIYKLNVSKANFYKNYSEKANILREKYKSQSLF